MWRLTLFAAGLGITISAWWWTVDRAYDRGRADEAADVAAKTLQMQQQLFRVADALSETTAALEAERAVRDALAKEIANEAANDPRRNDPGLGVDSLRRLDRIR